MKILILIAAAVAAVAATMFFVEPIPQDPAYHKFADQLTIFSIPSFWNVMSNAAIALFAFAGIIRSATLSDDHIYHHLRRQFGILFTAALITAAGSVHYHLSPTNDSLVFDRLPMAIVFTCLLSLTISLFVSETLGRLSMLPLIIAGAASVLYWNMSEQAGQGDLRFYALTQFLSAALMLLIVILYRASHRPVWSVLMILIFYAMAKAAEHFDHLIYHYTGMISGHSIKHLIAAAALLVIYLIAAKKSPRVE